MTHTTDSTAHLAVEIPDAPAIPGLRFRRWAGPSDLPAMHTVAAAARLAEGDAYSPTIEQMELDYAHLTNSDPYQDLIVAFVGDQLVAYARCQWTDRNDGLRSYDAFGFVDPAWARRGIGSAMQRWTEARCLRIAEGHEPDRPRVLGSWGEDRNEGNVGMLTAAGFTIERRFVHMVRPTLEAIEVPPMPAGLEVRPATMDHARAMFDGDTEAFQDHWGSTDSSEEAWIRFRDRPGLDPSLWVLAWDGDEAAGGVLLEIDPPTDGDPAPQLGWLARVWVRRPWRKRGLARALIGCSLVELRERGLDGAQLGVDTENAQGALGLYTASGFEVESAAAAWRKPWPVPVPVPDGDGTSLGWRRR